MSGSHFCLGKHCGADCSLPAPVLVLWNRSEICLWGCGEGALINHLQHTLGLSATTSCSGKLWVQLVFCHCTADGLLPSLRCFQAVFNVHMTKTNPKVFLTNEYQGRSTEMVTQTVFNWPRDIHHVAPNPIACWMPRYFPLENFTWLLYCFVRPVCSNAI